MRKGKLSDKAALLSELFEKYKAGMYKIAWSILKNEFQAEDAVGDAFEKVIPYLTQHTDGNSAAIRLLLVRLVKTSAIDIYRKNQKEKGKISMDEVIWLPQLCIPSEAYTQAVQYEEIIEKLQKELLPGYWEVIYLRYFEGRPVKEIALLLELDEENVYSRLRRARAKARALLEKEGFDA